MIATQAENASPAIAKGAVTEHTSLPVDTAAASLKSGIAIEPGPGVPLSMLKAPLSSGTQFQQATARTSSSELNTGPISVQMDSKTLSAPVPQVSNCALPKGLSFRGDAHFPCDVQINGTLEGKLTAEPNKTITVAETGEVKGALVATNVRVEGKADGQITADGGLASFGPKSVCIGQISYGRLGIEEGAEVEASMKKVPVKTV